MSEHVEGCHYNATLEVTCPMCNAIMPLESNQQSIQALFVKVMSLQEDVNKLKTNVVRMVEEDLSQKMKDKLKEGSDESEQ